MRALVVLVAFALSGCVGLPGPGTTSDSIGPPVTYAALKIETDKGPVTAILYANETPQTVAFIETLVKAGYYDGREFGRVVPGFVIQEVDRAGGATDQKKTVPPEFGTAVRFSAGALGIARNADPNSGGSEFFVMDFAASHLDGNYTAFGQVVEGLDVIHAIARVQAVSIPGAPVAPPIDPGVGPTDRAPVQPVKMTKVTLGETTLPASVAARYPLVTGPPVRIANGRASLEWTHDIRAGHAGPLTWYLFTRPETTPPDLTGAKVTIAGEGHTTPQVPALLPDAADGRALHFTWTPPAAGRYNATLTNATRLVAWTDIEIR
jgi:peptidyl-prolyl cis-trans isomerase B (cyclophilin B)